MLICVRLGKEVYLPATPNQVKGARTVAEPSMLLWIEYDEGEIPIDPDTVEHQIGRTAGLLLSQHMNWSTVRHVVDPWPLPELKAAIGPGGPGAKDQTRGDMSTLDLREMAAKAMRERDKTATQLAKATDDLAMLRDHIGKEASRRHELAESRKSLRFLRSTLGELAAEVGLAVEDIGGIVRAVKAREGMGGTLREVVDAFGLSPNLLPSEVVEEARRLVGVEALLAEEQAKRVRDAQEAAKVILELQAKLGERIEREGRDG